MKDIPDSPLRLYLRLVLKGMIALAAIGTVVVAVRFLGGGADEDTGRERFDLGELAPGGVRTVGWNGRAVIVLHRAPATVDALGAALDDDPSPGWYVAYAAGTATGCSIVWHQRRDRFRESCGSAAWDAAGRPLPGNDAAPLRAPPHRITPDERLILGAAGS